MHTTSSTADDIMTCARTLIVAGGYSGFSYADIANVVGIRKPSIHHHFPTKAGLVRAVVIRYRQQTRAGLDHIETQNPDPVAQLQAYTAYWEACIANASVPFCVCALLAAELPVLPAEIAAEVRAYFRMLSAWIASVIERGAKADRIRIVHPPHVEGEAFMATVHGAMLSARAYGDPQVFSLITAPLLTRIASQS